MFRYTCTLLQASIALTVLAFVLSFFPSPRAHAYRSKFLSYTCTYRTLCRSTSSQRQNGIGSLCFFYFQTM